MSDREIWLMAYLAGVVAGEYTRVDLAELADQAVRDYRAEWGGGDEAGGWDGDSGPVD